MTSTLSAHDLIEEAIRSMRRMAEEGWRGFDCSPEALSLIHSWGEDRQDQPISDSDTLPRIREDLGRCERCELYRSRTRIIFGSGDSSAELIFIGAQLEYEDDQQGEPFVGPAGQLLTRIIAAMKLDRREVYLCNIVKCRPPDNRPPLPSEIDTCMPFLKRQIDAIDPTAICCMGSLATRTLLDTDLPITQLRGRFHNFKGIKVMPTFHPSELLQHPEKKRDAWADIQKIMRLLKIPVG